MYSQINLQKMEKSHAHSHFSLILLFPPSLLPFYSLSFSDTHRHTYHSLETNNFSNWNTEQQKSFWFKICSLIDLRSKCFYKSRYSAGVPICNIIAFIGTLFILDLKKSFPNSQTLLCSPTWSLSKWKSCFFSSADAAAFLSLLPVFTGDSGQSQKILFTQKNFMKHPW